MARYHFNPKTGNASICEAKARSCPLGEVNHVEGDQKAALSFQEARLRETYTNSFAAAESAEPAVTRGIVKVSKALKQYTYYPNQQERDALALYARSGYGSINKVLRNVLPADPRTLTAIENLDSLFRNAPERKEKVEIYRKTASWPDGLTAKEIVGKTIAVDTFLSSSSDKNYLSVKNIKRPRNIHWTFTVDPEVKLIDVNAIGESNMVHESEILVNRNVELLVSQVEHKNGVYSVTGVIKQAQSSVEA